MTRLNNIVAMSDSYKYSHPWQFPPKTQGICSYIEARGYDKKLFGDVPPEVVFFGLDILIDRYLKTQVTTQDVEFMAGVAKLHGVPFALEDWRKIVEVHNGFLPISIRALPEGTVAPISVPLLQIKNTDAELPWLSGFVETMLQRAVWYPSTVATVSREIKKVINRFLEETGDPTGLSFKLHDFGARGATSHESAEIGGLAHLVNFLGTDTMEAVYLGWNVYGEVLGHSIPASEHSTITSWGRSHEVDAFENMLTSFPTGPVACVSDSYDIFQACSELWPSLKDKIFARDGFLVVRPDSGDPVSTTLKVIEILGEKFGTTVNDKGYKLLHPKIRIIQGDGINRWSIEQILDNYKTHGWSADNIAFGMGGALLQNVNRDSLSFAQKANEAIIGGEIVDVYKDPITSKGKASKRGAQAVIEHDGSLASIRVDDLNGRKNLLERRWYSRLGVTTHVFEKDFQVIRDRAAI